ncbi:2,3-bisphosphoglycerate-independent phosphoglycerate mutase, partial [Patescibacteria group bacterium]|nr:2,3-bisphosphoglycerate-independent phosphoglycerate mutase [Patescibacteria group bacterium]
MAKKPHVLVIADGVGVDVPSSSNAVALAKKYNLDYFVSHYYATTLYASSEYVGLPLGSFGNSEVGHLNIGAGKIVYQDVLNINRAIRDKSFFINSKIQDAILNVKKKKSKLHLVGTLSYSPRNS